MTGFGAASREGEGPADGWSAEAEVRSVNNKGLKLSSRVVPGDQELETRLDRLVRGRLRRGSVTLSVTLSHADEGRGAGFDSDALAAYWASYKAAAFDAGLPEPRSIEPLLTLPGVVGRSERVELTDAARDLAAAAVEDAIDGLEAFREREGRDMRTDLAKLSAEIRRQLDPVAARAPGVAADHRDRLTERVAELLKGTGAELPESSIVREAAVFAERADINEEITRLSSHLGHFEQRIAAEDVEGRKLDFLGQEMFREINTIGSKANDLEISRHVVEMKAAAEKIREMVQNVE